MSGRTKRRVGRWALYAVWLSATLFSTAHAVAQTAPTARTTPADPEMRELLARATRMQAALGRLAKDSDSSGARAFLHLALGTAYAGLGVGVALDTHEKPRDSLFRGIAVTESLAIGGTYIGKSIYGFSLDSSFEEHRYARFLRDVREHRMTELRLAQYEGELYVEAVYARNGRRIEAWMNLGGAFAGAGLIALAAASDMTGAARGLTYLEGAVLTPTCAVAAIIGFVQESTIEKEWRRYRAEQSTAPRAQLTLLPVLTQSRALLVVGGSF